MIIVVSDELKEAVDKLEEVMIAKFKETADELMFMRELLKRTGVDADSILDECAKDAEKYSNMTDDEIERDIYRRADEERESEKRRRERKKDEQAE